MRVTVFGIDSSNQQMFEHVDVLGTISQPGVIARQENHTGVVVLVNPMHVQSVVIRPDVPEPVARDTVEVWSFGEEPRVYVAKAE